MPAKINAPEKKRTVQTGLSATTVSMKGMAGLFPASPAKSHRAQCYEETQAADHEQPEAPICQGLGMEFRVEHARNDVVSTGDGEEREAPQQCHVGVAGNPVGLGDDGVHGTQAVHGPLEAGEEVEDDAGHEELQGHLSRSRCHWPFMVAKKL